MGGIQIIIIRICITFRFIILRSLMRAIRIIGMNTVNIVIIRGRIIIIMCIICLRLIRLDMLVVVLLLLLVVAAVPGGRGRR